LRIGQLVCALGAPFNQDYSFTAGWVSGKGRTDLLGPTSRSIVYEDYIQTDAFINPGNSGGPLFDVEGKIVGMNTLINAVDRGIAFAIPSNMLQQVSAQLIQNGRVQRPWLGIRIETLGRNGARESVGGIDKGVIVMTKEANAPAARSDLRPEDVITEVDGVRVSAAHDLQKEILKKKVGQTVQLTVWRGGSSLSVPVATGELPNELTKSNLPPKRLSEARFEGFGLKLKDRKPQGATVLSVVPDTAAAGADLQPDDVISEVDAKPVGGAEECITAIALRSQASKGKGVTLNVERKGKRLSVLLNPEK
jgi:S1-C subfamily serine protease